MGEALALAQQSGGNEPANFTETYTLTLTHQAKCAESVESEADSFISSQGVRMDMY